MPPGTQVGPFSEVRCNVKCVITDESRPGSRSVQNLPSSTTISELYKLSAEHAVCKIDDFILLYLKPLDQADEEVVLDKDSPKILVEVVRRNLDTECHFVMRKTSEASEDDSPLGFIGPILHSDGASYGAIAAPPLSDTKTDQPRREFTGLINQAMTCYLNSLLQTLFMTPEFRNALYRWEYQGDVAEAEKSIPFQLQKLFLKMQTTKKLSVETTDLTHSFGWDSSEAWQQHDVQELCRVMFDALEETLKNTEQEHLINQLYQGKMKDYVKCLKCGYESAREDTYLDIPLAIRPFGAQQAHESLEEALQQFIRSETLEGNNQYFCEKCDSKQDAQKGLKFETFPYLLTFQLKRFTFDYTTLQRIKLHDRLTFADVLDMNLCCKDLSMNFEALSLSNHEEQEIKSEATPSSSADDSSCTAACNGTNDEAPSANSRPLTNDGKPDLKYELFSIMIHSGNALGGHYYAYIKSFTDGKWYCFNDQTVSLISRAEIENSYGGSEKRSRQFYSSNYASSTNAYMLLYRQVDENTNAHFMTPDGWPEHINKLARQLEREETNEAVQKEKDRNTCKIRIFARHPETKELTENKLEIHKEKTLAEATGLSRTLFGFDDLVAIEDCRLIKFDSTYESYEKSFEEHEGDTIQDVLGGMRYAYGFDLFLETKARNKEFFRYKSDGITVKVHNVDLERREVKWRSTIHLDSMSTVVELKDHLDEFFGYPKEKTRVVLGRNYNDFRLLVAGSMSLRIEGCGKSIKVFVEASGTESADVSFDESKMLEVLEQFANTIKLNITLPLLADTTNQSQEIQIYIDQRKTLQELKDILHPHVRIPTANFRVYKVHASSQEVESTRLNEKLTSFVDDMKVIIRLGRALQVGESRAKVYHFKPNDSTPISFLMETIIAQNTSVLDMKKRVLPEVVKHINKDVTLERIRLRKKSWKNPSQVLPDKVVFRQDVIINCPVEYLIEVLEGEDRCQTAGHRSIYTKRWRPSSHTFDPFVEVVVNNNDTLDQVKEELSRISSVPACDIEVAKGRGVFPCDICPLDITRELDWDPTVRTIQEYPMSIADDGAVLYYRDKNEQLEELTEASEKQIKESSNNRRPQPSLSTKQPVRGRKEKALKIYTNRSTKIS